MAKQKIALPGMVYERLTVIRESKPRLQPKSKGSNIMIPTRMVECRCSCNSNKVVIVLAIHLSSGRIKSCGCYNAERIRQKHSPESVKRRAVKRTIYTSTDIAAKRFIGQIPSYKEIEEDIILNPQNLSKYISLMESSCFYCFRPPSQKKKVPKKLWPVKYWIHNGIDAVDPSLGHTMSNIVSCCKQCNYAKSEMTLIDFYNHIHLMYEYRSKIYNDCYTTTISPIDISNLKWQYDDNILLKTNIKYDVFPSTTIGKLQLIEKVLLMRSNGKRGSHWVCKCGCGTLKTIRECELKNGRAMSCGRAGCRASSPKYLPINSALNNVYSSYERNDKEKNRIFSISLNNFKLLTQMNCVYCGKSPQNGNAIKYNGLDRIDSKLGHIMDNIVPCCGTCNNIKSDLSLADLDHYITTLYQNSEQWLKLFI